MSLRFGVFSLRYLSDGAAKEKARRGTQTFGVHPHLKHLNPGDAITVLPSILRLTRRVTRLPHFGHDGIKAAGISLPVSRQRSLTSCSLKRCHECRSRILGCAPASGRTATSSPRSRSFMAECSPGALSAACGGSTPGSGSRDHCTGSAQPVANNLCHGLVIKPSRGDSKPKTPAALVVASRGWNHNEHDGRRQLPAGANAWLAERKELAHGRQVQSSSDRERR